MDRKPEHLEEDPGLRKEFVSQESWDEFIERKIAEIEPDDPTMAQELRDDTSHSHPVFQFWNHLWLTDVIDPETRVDEVYYLAGYVDAGRRMAAIDQQHASLRVAAQAKGMFEIPSVEGIQEFNLGEE